MSTSEPNAFEARHGGRRSAKGAPVGDSGESQPRRQEILRADPYYPHTVLRALLLAAITFLSTVGLSVVLILMFWPREITWGLMAVSYTHLTLPTIHVECRSRWSPYH